MERPDSEGYVNITWPSRNVPHGGIFHTRKAEPSAEQQQFLKVLAEESKLNLKLRQTRAFGLRADDSRAGARVASAETKPVARPSTSRRRSLSAIRSSGILDMDMYRPLKRGEDRERMKERLANTMAFGDSPEQKPLAPQPRAKPPPKLPTNKEKWNDLVTQIRERAEWLAEMELLGEAAAAPHREIVQGQIAERMRALDALGVDSECSSARSTARSSTRSSAHSTVHSTSADSRAEVHLTGSHKAKKQMKASAGRRPKRVEEHVAAYNELSPLRYSPRRRV